MYKTINGIQHIGIGVPNLEESWKWYRKYFGLDIPLFENEAEADLMKEYNKGMVLRKKAVLALNIKGGCAVEILEPLSFKSISANFNIQLGDLGIFISKVKTTNINTSHELFVQNNINVSQIGQTPDGRSTFYVTDPNGLLFQVLECNNWFSSTKHVSGGMLGTVIGVSEMDKSVGFYQNILGFTEVIYDKTGHFSDYSEYVPGSEGTFRRVLLSQPEGTQGNWGAVAGKTEIELIQVMDRKPVKIFKGRQWGDTGFVHLGFDAKGLSQLEKDMEEAGYPFTCDSKNALNIGKTSVHCVYIEDPDNTLIEFIEVYKVPIIEKWGVFMDVQKRDPKKPLSSFMLKLMRFNRVKDN
ncbi:MAG: VOC family protein [Cyclobacteriaceae bacterium]|nr:VOC family protein [Cyclobacteriaceae bacterium]